PNVTRAATPPTVLFAHNVEHVIWQRMREVERRAWRRALLALESRKMRRYEALACARARLTIAVSDADRRLLAAVAPSARVSAVPTGVDVDYFAPDCVAEVPGRLVFTGSMDWYPNEDGIVHFIEAVLPRVRRQGRDDAATGAGRESGGREPGPQHRQEAVLLAEGRRRIRKPMRGGASRCELACSVWGTWGA